MKTLAILALVLAVITVTPVHSQTETVIKTKDTDALTESIVIPSGKSVTIASGATITAASGSTVTGFGGTPAWGDITGTPTTLAGYGISDAITAAVAASTYQPLNAKLTAISDLASAAGVLTNNGSGTFGYTATSAGGNGAADNGKLPTFNAQGYLVALSHQSSPAAGTYPFSNYFQDGFYYNQSFLIGGTLKFSTLTATRAITLPDATGTVALTSSNISGTAAGLSSTLAVASGGTGATTATAARIALLPSMTANGGKFLRVNAGATDYELATIGGGGDALVSGSLDQFADVTQTATKTLAITESTTLAGGTHSGTNTGDQATITGNAGTATALQTGRAINGVTFDGTAAITVTAAAGTLSGSTLASGVTSSSLTSFGAAPALGTPSAVVLTNATGLPVATGISGLGTGIATAMAVNVGTAGSPVINGGALGTPSSGTATNLSGTASGLTAGTATAAEGIKTATTTVVVSSAAAPTAGQVITATSSTAANWQTPSGGGGSANWTLMSTTTLSANSSVTLALDGYRRYQIEFEAVLCSLDGYALQMQVSNDAGSTWNTGASDYDWGASKIGQYTDTSGTGAFIRLTALTGNGTGEGISGVLTVLGANDPALQFTVLGKLMEPAYNSAWVYGWDIVGRRAATSDVDAVKIYFSNGTLLSGKIRVFGWSE